VMVWAVVTDRRPTAAPTRAAGGAARSPAPLPTEPISLQGATIEGKQTARLVIIEYSEFQCPYCGKFAREVMPQLRRDYVETGKVIVAFRHFPLESLHASALGAAGAAECSRQQGRFLEMHDSLFANQSQLRREDLVERARVLKLDLKQFGLCLDGLAAQRVREDQASARALGVTGTPTFFIGALQPDGRVKVAERLTGAQPLAQFRSLLDRLMAQVDTAANSPQTPK
jgi:protein-disulfide isomerase